MYLHLSSNSVLGLAAVSNYLCQNQVSCFQVDSIALMPLSSEKTKEKKVNIRTRRTNK